MADTVFNSILQRGRVLTAEDAGTTDYFGTSVAISADGLVLAVGANGWDGASTDQGGVYLFDWNGSAWVQRGSILTASDAAASDGFGFSVALNADGTILAVGAWAWEGANTDQGGVYLYDIAGSTFTQRGSVLTASDAAASDAFGVSVSLNAAGTVLAVGAYLWEGANTDQGGVYLYDISGSTFTQRGSVLTASDAAASDYFGVSVSLNADASILAVGAYKWEGANADQGGVYLYDISGSTFTQRGSVLTASDAAASDFFGRSVALNSTGTTLAVGAQKWEGTVTDQGGVYLYDISGSTFTQRGSVLTASDAAASDAFGVSVSLNANASLLIVGASAWEGPIADQGGVYTFDVYGYRCVGTVVDDVSAPAARKLFAHERSNGRLVGEMTSSAVDGSFTMGVCTSNPVYVVALDDDAGTQYNAIVYDRVVPA